MAKLDLKDKQILALLDQNARMTLTEIARKTRLNKDVVRYRINKLENGGVILGYYAIIDNHKLGYLTVRIYFDLIDLDQETEKKLITFLDKEFKAGQIFRIDGEYQLGILTWENSIYELERKLKLLKERFGEFLGRYDVNIFTEFHHYFRKYLPNVPKNSLVIKQASLQEIDKTDIDILHELSSNARLTSVELAKRLSLPQRTVIYHIKALEKKKIILGYRTNINIAALGYENYFLEIYIHTDQNLHQIEYFAQQNEHCIGFDYRLYGADIEIEIEVPNRKAILQFINELKQRFKRIKKIRYWSTIDYPKINYFPAK